MSQLQLDTSANRRIGIAFFSLATLMFASLDGVAKWLVLSLPVVQVVWVRFFLHTVITGGVLVPQLGLCLFKTKHPKWQIIRGLMLATMTGTNFWALQYLQLAQTGSVQFSVPILIALISVIGFGEKIDTGRWIAIFIGFVGVLVIIRPGTEAFHPAILLCVIGAILYASFNILTRRLARDDHPGATQWTSAFVASVVLAPFALWQWQMPHGWLQWSLLILTGCLGGFGHWAIASAHRYASAAVLGPFLYQQIIYMTLLGWLIFNQVPDHFMVVGTLIVVAAGLYLLWREFQQSQTLKNI
ncbi:MAG: DMT family transporter [Betaproteobacteria bacterium]|nr:DMT family transporter [Betaproteobacteria bacterium]NBT68471.1 DMT family transporter [Betaproteobacteria bacterium]NBY08159.1 DMT family transporter [Betaproteobacteria bacterium]